MNRNDFVSFFGDQLAIEKSRCRKHTLKRHAQKTAGITKNRGAIGPLSYGGGVGFGLNTSHRGLEGNLIGPNHPGVFVYPMPTDL